MSKEIIHGYIGEKRKLTKEGSLKEIYHLELNFKEKTMPYVVGDCLAVMPENDFLLVEAIISSLGLDGGKAVEYRKEKGPLYHFLLKKCALSSLPKRVFEQYFAFAKCKFEEERWPSNFLGWDFLDLTTELGKVSITPQELVDLLPPLLPRFYSIASSPIQGEGKVALTIKVPSYELFNRRREGVCSRHLLCRDQVDFPFELFHHPHRGFTLHEPERPIIMVGPGTGVAPFRGFIEERWHKRASGKNWLFFGECCQATDFLYEEEWLFWKKEGFLDLDLAFSRDQSEKIYVQHKMVEKSQKLFRLLEEGAIFYVCGDKERMAKDVEKTLIHIIEKEGGRDGREYIKQLRHDKRYLRDVY